MKKVYKKPALEVTEFCFSEHIAASGGNNCHWGGGATWTHGYIDCDDNYNPGTGGWVGLNG